MTLPIENTMDINGLVTLSERLDAECTEIPLNADQLKFDPAGIVHNGQLIRMDQASRQRLFTKVGAPARYFEKHSPAFRAAALAEHASRGDFGHKPTLVVQDGSLVTIAAGELLDLPNAAVIRSVVDGVGTESEGLVVARISHDAERLDAELVSPAKGIAVRVGDIVHSGIHIVHHRFGAQATLIEAFIYRLVCRNGMTRRECVGDRQPRTRKLPVDFPNNAELQMNQIRRLTRQTWNGLQAQLDALRATSERAADVEKLLSRWLQRAKISVDRMMPRLRAAWQEEGGENTYYGAVNALTRVATHHRDLSERQRRMLASLAGLLAFAEVHLCERCFSVLAGAVEDNNHVD